MRVHESGYELDPSRDRLDLDLIEQWLAAEAYWALGRPRSVIERSIDNSTVYGLYGRSGEQVGVFRVVTDNATFAWLCDVFIDKEHRGNGLAQWAVAHIRDDLLATGVYRIILATADAHGVYEKVGFAPLAEPDRLMALTTRRIGES
ncbi:MAG TPA: GNAT family N-acetyltransferase [Micromonosporaceae bacterium]|nr:GNAT family N-acetyltransferase [Micromonosporaceae bacterium]